MSQYSGLSELRQELTSEDADDRVDAYVSVRDAGLDPDDDVLVADPTDHTVQVLRENGVIPEASDDYQEAAETRERMVDLLERIATAVEGGDSA